MVVQGVCKDCYNGTLNNDLNPAFDVEDEDEDGVYLHVTCNKCGSGHVDVHQVLQWVIPKRLY